MPLDNWLYVGITASTWALIYLASNILTTQFVVSGSLCLIEQLQKFTWEEMGLVHFHVPALVTHLLPMLLYYLNNWLLIPGDPVNWRLSKCYYCAFNMHCPCQAFLGAKLWELEVRLALLTSGSKESAFVFQHVISNYVYLLHLILKIQTQWSLLCQYQTKHAVMQG